MLDSYYVFIWSDHMIWFCCMTESNLQNKFSSITKRNLKFKIYFLKNISLIFSTVLIIISISFYITVLGTEKQRIDMKWNYFKIWCNKRIRSWFFFFSVSVHLLTIRKLYDTESYVGMSYLKSLVNLKDFYIVIPNHLATYFYYMTKR